MATAIEFGLIAGLVSVGVMVLVTEFNHKSGIEQSPSQICADLEQKVTRLTSDTTSKVSINFTCQPKATLTAP